MKGKKLKFKAGDKVRVRSLEWYNEKKDSIGRIPIGKVFTDAMSKYCGSILTIKEIFEDIYIVNENTKNWEDWMLEDEPVTEEKQEVEQLNKDKMETKEMTKEEIFEYLKDAKVFCASTEETQKVQKKLFELKYKFVSGFQAVKEDIYLLYIYKGGVLQCGTDLGTWISDTARRIEPNEILSLKLKEEEKPKFDPKTLRAFDKVLVRDCNTEKWRARFFDRREECGECEYGTTCNCFWVYCIPYNEETKHLHGTTNEVPEFYRI